MICKKCGKPFDGPGDVCPRCGAENSASGTAGKASVEGDTVVFCPDGKYRWIYELNLYKNPTVFFLVWKILICITLGIFAVVMIADAVEWPEEFLAERLPGDLRFLLYFLTGVTLITLAGYLIYAAVSGGKYCVVFEMDEKGVNHVQLPPSAKKAEAISFLSVLAGTAAKSATTAGIGLNAARTELYSAFSSVKRVRAYPRRCLIKLDSPFNHNQIYAGKNDFEFVLNHIKSRATGAK